MDFSTFPPLAVQLTSAHSHPPSVLPPARLLVKNQASKGAIGHLEVTPLAEQGRASSGCLESSSSSSSSSEGSDEEYDPSSSRFKSKSKVTAAGRPGIHKVKRAQPRGALAGTQQGCTPAISVQATARQSKAPMKSGAKMPWPQQASAADEGAPLLVPPNKEPVAKKRPAKASYGKPQTMDLVFPAAATLRRSSEQSLLFEVQDPSFDLEGDAGVVGRLCQKPRRGGGPEGVAKNGLDLSGSATGSPTGICLDIRNTVYELQACPMPVTAAVIRAAPGGAEGTIEAVFSTVIAANPMPDEEGAQQQAIQGEEDEDDEFFRGKWNDEATGGETNNKQEKKRSASRKGKGAGGTKRSTPEALKHKPTANKQGGNVSKCRRG